VVLQIFIAGASYHDRARLAAQTKLICIEIELIALIESAFFEAFAAIDSRTGTRS
jgi:hypothetical protein